MSEDSAYQCHSDSGVFVMLPTGSASPQRLTLPIPANFPSKTIGDVGAHLPQPLSPTLSESPSSSSAASEGDTRRKLAIFNANIQRSYFRMFSLIGDVIASRQPRQQKANIWHQALKKKRDLAFQMLETQKVIEKVEDEVVQHLARDTIVCLHSKFYNAGGDGTADGLFLSSISAISVNQQPN
ncbi:hypothetical protein BU15DRAFT_66900 [Melanogaster broomeanus]|nr:hypothetical protein BU15DRAFT_66900 [Melanogaster broomeanus]